MSWKYHHRQRTIVECANKCHVEYPCGFLMSFLTENIFECLILLFCTPKKMQRSINVLYTDPHFRIFLLHVTYLLPNFANNEEFTSRCFKHIPTKASSNVVFEIYSLDGMANGTHFFYHRYFYTRTSNKAGVCQNIDTAVSCWLIEWQKKLFKSMSHDRWKCG